MQLVIESLIAFFLILGSAFVLIGSFGLVRLPNLMSRLHGPSKATTLGVGGCLIASMIHFAVIERQLSVQEVLITFFLIITAPVTAHFIAKVHLHTEVEPTVELPKAHGSSWSTFGTGAGESEGH